MSSPPLSTYFRKSFMIKDAAALRAGAQFTVIADDGVVAYVNGQDVGRKRVDDIGAALFSTTYANEAISTNDARRHPVRFFVPGNYLKTGLNVVAVQVIANYQQTSDISFTGKLTAIGNGAKYNDSDVPRTVGRPNPNLKLAWSDEFRGNSLDTNNWTAENESTYGDGGGQTECLMNRPRNLIVRGGALHITARRENPPLKCGNDDSRFPNGRNFSSAHIKSQGKVSFMYGRIEMRAKMPVTQGRSSGLWPAFWLRPNDGGLGEIDIVESLGSGPGDDWSAGIVHQTVHRDYTGNTPSSGYNYQMPQGKSKDDGYHTYAVEWSPTEMRWYVDNRLTRTVGPDDISWYKEALTGRDFFIRINMAVGGRWPGYADGTTRFPATYSVDYVRLYK